MLTDGSLWGKLKKKSLEALGKDPDDPNAAAELKEEATLKLHKAAKGAFKVGASAYAIKRQAQAYYKDKKKALEEKLEKEGNKALEESGAKAKAMGFYEHAKNHEKSKKVLGTTQGWVEKVKTKVSVPHPHTSSHANHPHTHQSDEQHEKHQKHNNDEKFHRHHKKGKADNGHAQAA